MLYTNVFCLKLFLKMEPAWTTTSLSRGNLGSKIYDLLNTRIIGFLFSTVWIEKNELKP